jgi:acyl-CoA thioester hydrolase
MTTKTYIHVKHIEVDGMGIVHHSNYPLWFEKARKDHLKKAGISSSQIFSQGFYLPLSEMACKFKRPVKHGDEILVTTKILSMSCVNIKFEYEVLDSKEEKLIAKGKTVHVWTNRRIEPINIEKTAPYIYQRLKQFIESENAT